MAYESANRIPRIAGAGVCCQDYIVVAPRVNWGDTTHVVEFLAQGGGLVATAIVACARLGAHCEMFSLLGNDQIGDEIVSELEAEGANTSHISRTLGAKSPFSFIHVDQDTGERTIFHRPAVGLEAPEDIDFSSIADCGALLVDDVYAEFAARAARVARKHGVPVIADCVPGPRSERLLPHVDVLIAPKHFAEKHGWHDDLDFALKAIHDLGPKTAVITLGADGYIWSDGKTRGRGRAYDVEVVDTTGAGDVFHGAFAYGLTTGWDTAQCCDFAAAVAAIKCTKRGGRTGIPTLEQALAFMADRQN
jgi:sulfofructose kinase